MMYLVQIVSGKPIEIKNVMAQTGMDLWNGVKANTLRLAESIARTCYDIEPWIEIDIIELAA